MDWVFGISGLTYYKALLVLVVGISMIVYGWMMLDPGHSASAQTNQANGWTNGPAGTQYVDMPDGVRCYRVTFSDHLSCVKP